MTGGTALILGLGSKSTFAICLLNSVATIKTIQSFGQALANFAYTCKLSIKGGTLSDF